MHNTHPDSAWLESMYNNRVLVPEHARHLAQWAADSARVRAGRRPKLDMAYGDGLKETLDVFPAASSQPAPVLVFLHGGYWRALDKSDHSFLAPAFTRQGICVVVPNYALCPAITVPGIVMQMVNALAWTWRHVDRFGGDPSRITVAGHSAGGHLAAMMLACQWRRVGKDLPQDLVRNALSISGLYELEPLRHTPFLKDLHLTAADARRASPALMPPPAQGALYSVAGGDESAEFLRHNALIQQAWGRERVPVSEDLPGLHHFSVLEALADPRHRLHRLALELLG